MEALRKYIYDTLGISIQLERLQSHEMSRFPFFIKQNFHFFIAQLFDRDFILAHLINEQELTGLTQITRQLKILNEGFERPTVLILDDVPAITRKRLVGKGINFIVPGKQMYLPAVLVDFNEVFKKPFPKNEQLMPSAQVILFYQFLKRDINIEELQFKQLAEDLNYSAMTITKAAENLKYHDLCQIIGTKEKFIHFISPPKTLWETALSLLIDPVVNRFFVDQYPNDITLLKSNISALSEYSDLNPDEQDYRAIDKGLFYGLKRSGGFEDLNEYSGRICLEVWKYNPMVFAEKESKVNKVDPISLYLSLKETTDERIQLALDKTINSVLW